MGERPTIIGALRSWFHQRRRRPTASGWESVGIISFDFDEVATPNEGLNASIDTQASARLLLFDLLSQALTIFYNCINSGAHDRLVPDQGAGQAFVTQGVHLLPGLMKAAPSSAGGYEAAAEMFSALSSRSPAQGEEAARDSLFDILEAWFLELRVSTADRGLQTLANAMHNQPGLMKEAAGLGEDYQGIMMEFFRNVPTDYRVWAVQTLMRQPHPDPLLVDHLTTFDGGEEAWRKLTVTIDYADGRRERKAWVSDPSIDWLCSRYDADKTI